jgi:hypothetical protein
MKRSYCKCVRFTSSEWKKEKTTAAAVAYGAGSVQKCTHRKVTHTHAYDTHTVVKHTHVS